MARACVVLLVLLGLCCGPASAQNGRLANSGKAGLYVKSLEQMLRLPDDDIDLATGVLIASEYWSDIVYGRRYLEQLDSMAIEIQKRLQQQRLPCNYRAIPVINEYLFNELGFKTISHANDPNDLFLHSVMDRRQGYCLSLSVLYLALAERLELNLYGVVVPGHFFVRYDAGRVRFNIETTSNGASPPDDHYMVKFNVPDSSRDTIYMKNLTKRQTLGCFFNNLGNVYSDIGNLDMALVALERAVAINPTLSESRANLGNIYLQKDRVNDAIQQYKAALKLNPNDPKTYNNLGNAYTEIDRLNEAVSSYRQSLKLDPNFVDAYRNLALVCTRQERYGEAMSHLTEASRLDPQNAQIYNQFGDVCYRAREYDKAITQFHKALGLKPDLAEAYNGLGTCYREQGQTANEIQAYRGALAIKPDMLAALVNLGNAYFNQKDYKSAIQYYDQAAKIKPDDAWIYYNLGAAYSNNEDFERAVKAYAQAVILNPKIGDAHHGLAYGYYRLQKYDLAWKHLTIAKNLGVQIPADQIEAIKSRLK
jgi:tetratricopeptide (TPR) repeat protein